MLKMMKMDFNTRVGSFCVDTVDEIEKLPTLNAPGQDNLNTVYCAGMGSDCLVISDGAVYILNGNNEWVEFKDFSNSASGGGSDVDPKLDFLPHPEGVFAYYDYLSGVSEKVWTGNLNNTKINIIADVNNVFETNEEGVYITAPPNSNSVNIAPVGMLNESNKIFYLGYKDNAQGTNWNCLPFGEGGPKDNNLPKWNLNSYNNKPALWVSNNKHIYSNIDALSKFVAVAIMAYEGTASLFVNDKFIGTSTDLNRLFADYSLSCGATYKYFAIQDMISYNEIIENNKALAQKYGIEI